MPELVSREPNRIPPQAPTSVPAKPSILYIAGYGRSGSTVLDIILGNHEHIVSTGELSNLFRVLAHQSEVTCSCGEEVPSCSFWSRVITDVERQAGADWPRLAKISYQIERVLTPVFSGRGKCLAGDGKEGLRSSYARQMDILYRAIADHSGRNILVDSSKTAWITLCRPLALYRLCGFDVKVIYLTRDGRAVIYSGLRGSNKEIARGDGQSHFWDGYKVGLSWAVVNLLTLLMLRSFPRQQVMRLRYEDLVEHPEEVIDQLSAFIGQDLSDVKTRILSGGTLQTQHLVGGNRLARAQTIQLRADYEWKTSLSTRYRLFHYLVAWPLALVAKFAGVETRFVDRLKSNH